MSSSPKASPRMAPPAPQHRQLAEQTFDCAMHGLQRVQTYFQVTRCPACVSIERLKQEAEEEAQRRARHIAAFHAGLNYDAGGRFVDASLASFVCTTAAQRAAVAACIAFASGSQAPGAGLILIGPPGTGKTTLANATGHAWIDANGSPVRIITQRDLIRDIRATWRKDHHETEEEVITGLVSSTGLLVLDDAGVGTGTDAELTQLLDVIDGRYRRRLPTMVCSNLPLRELRAALGDRIYDRLREGAKFIACDWPSFRGKA